MVVKEGPHPGKQERGVEKYDRWIKLTYGAVPHWVVPSYQEGGDVGVKFQLPEVGGYILPPENTTDYLLEHAICTITGGWGRYYLQHLGGSDGEGIT